jgi:transposase-like protein
MPHPAQKATDEDIAKALMDQGGIVSAVARTLGMHRRTISNRIRASEQLQEAVKDARESCKDEAENQLFAKIKRGNLVAIIFYLKTQARDRGYSERHEHHVTGDMDTLIPASVRQQAVQSDEGLKALQSALETSLAESSGAEGDT